MMNLFYLMSVSVTDGRAAQKEGQQDFKESTMAEWYFDYSPAARETRVRFPAFGAGYWPLPDVV